MNNTIPFAKKYSGTRPTTGKFSMCVLSMIWDYKSRRRTILNDTMSFARKYSGTRPTTGKFSMCVLSMIRDYNGRRLTTTKISMCIRQIYNLEQFEF